MKHCGHEVLFASSGNVDSTTAKQLLDAWWKSPLNKKALTYQGPTKAGGPVVHIDGQEGFVAAIEIDY